jgi:phosphoribosylaminoimidazole (AIR) synthetase
VFAWLVERGVGEQELRRVFNCGIGMCAIVPPGDHARQVVGRVVRA